MFYHFDRKVLVLRIKKKIMYVCMYVWITFVCRVTYVCMGYLCMYDCCISVCVCVCMYDCMSACLFVCMGYLYVCTRCL